MTNLDIQVPEKRTATTIVTLHQKNMPRCPVILWWGSNFRTEKLLSLLLTIHLQCQAQCPEMHTTPWLGKQENWRMRWIDTTWEVQYRWNSSDRRRLGPKRPQDLRPLPRIFPVTWDIHPALPRAVFSLLPFVSHRKERVGHWVNHQQICWTEQKWWVPF